MSELRNTLESRAASAGLKVDKRWSDETLAEKLVEFQESQKEAEAKAVEAASDTWVYLLRDAFPSEDVKCLVGQTIKVPAKVAEHWYEAGVARPGKPQ